MSQIHDCKHENYTTSTRSSRETCDDCGATRPNHNSIWILFKTTTCKIMTPVGDECPHENNCKGQCGEITVICVDCKKRFTYLDERPVPESYIPLCQPCTEKRMKPACKHVNITYGNGVNTCNDCHMTKRVGGDKWIMGTQPIGCEHERIQYPINEGVPDQCLVCGAKRYKGNKTWHPLELKCSDCEKSYEHVGRYPLADFYQARCPQCNKILGDRMAKVVFSKEAVPDRRESTMGSGILSDVMIKRRIASGNIVISPYDAECVQPASYDLHLDTHFMIYKMHAAEIIDTRKPVAQMLDNITVDDYFVLHPKCFALGLIKEVTGVDNKHVGRLEGKSSLARLGLLIHTTAGFLDPGNSLQLTLELFNVSPLPIKLYPGMPIAQIAFEELQEACERPYKGLYKNVDHIQGSQIHKSFERYNEETGLYNQAKVDHG